jgi:hypothetical protein
MVLSFIVALIFGIQLLVIAFNTSILWGIGCLFVPFVGLLFVILHWDEAKTPFLGSLGSAVCFVVGAQFTR